LGLARPDVLVPSELSLEVAADFVYPNPDKPEIASYKHQMTNKFQITMSKSQTKSKII